MLILLIWVFSQDFSIFTKAKLMHKITFILAEAWLHNSRVGVMTKARTNCSLAFWKDKKKFLIIILHNYHSTISYYIIPEERLCVFYWSDTTACQFQYIPFCLVKSSEWEVWHTQQFFQIQFLLWPRHPCLPEPKESPFLVSELAWPILVLQWPRNYSSEEVIL